MVNSHIGETKVNNQGFKMTITGWNSCTDITVEFEDGYIATGKEYKQFKKGSVANRNYKLKNAMQIVQEKLVEERLGKVFIVDGEEYKVVDYKDSKHCFVKYPNGDVKNIAWSVLMKCVSGERDFPRSVKEGIAKQQNTTRERMRKQYIGMKIVNLDGDICEIIDLNNAKDITVLVDGTDIVNSTIARFKNGTARKKGLKNCSIERRDNYVGKSKKMDNGLTCTVKDYLGHQSLLVSFENSDDLVEINTREFITGHLKIKERAELFVVGYTYNKWSVLKATEKGKYSCECLVCHNKFENDFYTLRITECCKTCSEKLHGLRKQIEYKKKLVGTEYVSKSGFVGVVKNSENDLEINIEFEDGSVVSEDVKLVSKREIEPSKVNKKGFGQYGDYILGGLKFRLDDEKNVYYSCVKDNKEFLLRPCDMIEKYTDHLNETKINSQGFSYTFSSSISYDDCTFTFEDGAVLEHVSFDCFKTNTISHPYKHRLGVGTKVKNKQGITMEIINYLGDGRYDIKFEDGTVKENVFGSKFKAGDIRHPDYKDYSYNVGDKVISSCGFEAEIIERDNKFIRLKFSDGSERDSNIQSVIRGNFRPLSINIRNNGSYNGYILDGIAFSLGNKDTYYCCRKDDKNIILRPCDMV